jgi:hypothetical protein
LEAGNANRKAQQNDDQRVLATTAKASAHQKNGLSNKRYSLCQTASVQCGEDVLFLK